MAQITFQDLLGRVLQGAGTVCDYISAVVDRTSGSFEDEESDYMDFKVRLAHPDKNCVAETARDILAFSNTHGGVLLFGVTDSRRVVGHPGLDSHSLREQLGPYMGTMVEFEVGECKINIKGKTEEISYILTHRSTRAYPNLLRKDIFQRGGFGKKMKYVTGSLFYRQGNQTLVEPAGGDIDARAAELKFTGASPRTRSSFMVDQDRPGVRLYAHINDRFVGRVNDVAEVLSKFDDLRGRGVSIAGLGGIGKTELAIEVVSQAYKSGRFKHVYSGSAKKVLLGAFGPQLADPCFSDFPGFLRDLGAWLGLDFQAATPLEEMRAQCLNDLRSRKKVLMFVDNLETIEDGRLFQFLDQEIPESVWLLTTARVHKVKNYVYLKSLDAMNPTDAAHLLRHELKRQGLAEYASVHIGVLQRRAEQLLRHPLMIRWYAWNCRRQPENWSKALRAIHKADVEAFCVGHTLANISSAAQRTLGAIAATEDQIEVTADCLEKVSSIEVGSLEGALYELECAGLISTVVDDRTGRTTYTTIALATTPARELARKNNWESGFARGLREYVGANEDSPPADPLVRYLVQFDPSSIRTLTYEEIEELKVRVKRALGKPHSSRVPLLALAAECERHTNHIITADDYYKEAAESILANYRVVSLKAARILLEAATVAKFRSQTESQLRRATNYLVKIPDIDFAPLRILGMLVELSALVGDEASYKANLERVTKLRDEAAGHFTTGQVEALNDALSRAAGAIGGHSGGIQ